MRSSEPIVSAEDLTRIYQVGDTQVVGIKSIHLTVLAGELIVLKGHSGSGKSTLLSLLAGLDSPTRGRLSVAGIDLNHANEKRLTHYRRKTVGMIFQTFNLLPTLSVIENVCLPALLSGRAFKSARGKAEELLGWLQMAQRKDHLPGQLSGGEMQRAAIARALVNEPEIVLADEPTGNLDSKNGKNVIEILSELNRRLHRTVIIATHSDLADSVASRQISLKDGSILQ